MAVEREQFLQGGEQNSYFYVICWIMLWTWRFYLMYYNIDMCC